MYLSQTGCQDQIELHGSPKLNSLTLWFPLLPRSRGRILPRPQHFPLPSPEQRQGMSSLAWLPPASSSTGDGKLPGSPPPTLALPFTLLISWSAGLASGPPPLLQPAQAAPNGSPRLATTTAGAPWPATAGDLLQAQRGGDEDPIAFLFCLGPFVQKFGPLRYF
jgi:hypothetical protein